MRKSVKETFRGQEKIKNSVAYLFPVESARNLTRIIPHGVGMKNSALETFSGRKKTSNSGIRTFCRGESLGSVEAKMVGATPEVVMISPAINVARASRDEADFGDTGSLAN